MVSGHWSHDNIVYKMFAIDCYIMHEAITRLYYDFFFRWMTCSVSEDGILYGSMEWRINEMKVGALNEYIDSKYKE